MGSQERIQPQGVDAIAAAIVAFCKRLAPEVELRGRTLDLQDMQKNPDTTRAPQSRGRSFAHTTRQLIRYFHMHIFGLLGRICPWYTSHVLLSHSIACCVGTSNLLQPVTLMTTCNLSRGQPDISTVCCRNFVRHLGNQVVEKNQQTHAFPNIPPDSDSFVSISNTETTGSRKLGRKLSRLMDSGFVTAAQTAQFRGRVVIMDGQIWARIGQMFVHDIQDCDKTVTDKWDITLVAHLLQYRRYCCCHQEYYANPKVMDGSSSWMRPQSPLQKV
eukprot:6482516-Amphidinium_carterae.1